MNSAPHGDRDTSCGFSRADSTKNSRWITFQSFRSYETRFLSRDLIAGVTLAAIAIPEQMATARLGDFPAEVGFFAFLAGSLAFVVFGNNRLLSCGADSTITPIFAGGLALFATDNSADYGTLAAGLALLAGLMLVAAGYLRLGWVADLLSVPVTVGFLAGIAAHIFVSQMPTILGVPSPDGQLIERATSLVTHFKDTNPITLSMGLGVFVLVAVSERQSARIPAALFGLGIATAATLLFGLESNGVSVIGGVSNALPRLAMPAVSFGMFVRLVPLSLIIVIVVMVQTAATSRSFPPDSDESVDIDRDFVGVGIGCLVSGFAGAFPVNASPPRTAIIAATGGRSQLAGVVAAGMILVLIAFGTTLLRSVPQAALGGILLFVALRIIRGRQIAAIYRQSFGEFLLVVATTSAIIALPIEQGVAIGVALSLVSGIWSATRSRVLVFERLPGTSIWWPPTPQARGDKEPGIIVAGLQAPLSFLNAYHFRRDLLDILRQSADTQMIILEATGIVEIDFTGGYILCDVIRRCRSRGVDFAVARLESLHAQAAVARFGIAALLGTDHVFRSVDEAVQAYRSGLHATEAITPRGPEQPTVQ